MTRQPTPNVLDAVLGPVDAELSPLTTWEGGRLAHLEGIIEAGLQTFYDVGGALMEIREGRLYRQTHRSFEAYTKERWGMGKSRAHQLIEAASTVAAISGPVVEGEPSTMVDTLPTNESQVRPLAGLDDEAKREVWAEAVATAPAGKVTGRHVAQVAEKRQSPAPPDKGYATQHQIEAWLRQVAGTGAEMQEASVARSGRVWDELTRMATAAGYELSVVTPSAALRNTAAERFHKEKLARSEPDIVDVEPSPKPSTIVDTLPGRDGRIERAQRLIDQCRALTGRAFEDEYTALIGRPSDLLAVGRALDKIVTELEHLQRTLMGEPEVGTWGEL